MAVKIEKTTIIGDVLDVAPQAAPLFFAIGMHCLGCPSSRGETVEEACMVHGIDCDAFLAQLNHFLEAYEADQKNLHPRWNTDCTKVSFDSTHEGYRGIYMIDEL